MLTRFRSYADLAKALRRLPNSRTVRTISFDVFDTLVHRRMAPELVLEGVCHIFRNLLAELDIPPPALPLMTLRHEAYMELVAANVAAGLDPDTTLDELAPAWVARACGARLDSFHTRLVGKRLAAAEVELERRVCFANPWLQAVLPQLKDAQIQVLCVSDMYLGEHYVRAILEDCGLLPWIDTVHVSGDLRLLKRTGRIFGYLGTVLDLRPAAWLHVGDNFYADGVMANRNGLRAWIVNDRLIHTEARKQAFDAEIYRRNPAWSGMIAAAYAQPLDDELLSEEEAFGRKVLGPIFSSFVHRLLERCREERIDRVFFLAREGHLLKNLYGRLAPLVFVKELPPQPIYLAVSRLTSLLAAMHGYGIRELSAALANTGHYSLLALLAPLCLDPSILSAIALRNGLTDINAPLPAPVLEYPPLQRLLDDPDLQRHIGELGQTARELQHAYLAQSGFFDHDRVAVVDVGWGGQIQDSLFSSIRELPQRPTLFGFYLGANQQAAWRNCAGSRLEGLLADYQMPNWSSFAAFEFVFALEAASRAPHGTTMGYRRTSEYGICPLFKDADDPSRGAEMADDEFIALLQTGVLGYADHYAQCAGILRFSGQDTLPYARTMLERLVRYPNRQEITWWMRLNNVSDLGSTSTNPLGGPAIPAERLHSVLRMRTLLRNSPFHYGVIGLVAGAPAQVLLAAVKGFYTWRDYRPYPVPVFPRLATNNHISRPNTAAQEWENSVDDDFAKLRATAKRTALVDRQRRSSGITIAELLPMVAGYSITRVVAGFFGVALPKQEAPRLITMLRRHLHSRYNLHARAALLRNLARWVRH